MRKLYINDDLLKALFWVRAKELRTRGYFHWPADKHLLKLRALGAIDDWRKWRGSAPVWKTTPAGKKLVNEIIKYEEENPRYSAEEGPSALLYEGTLFSWAHLSAIREIENLRRMRQRTEERKAKTEGRKGCHETRLRAQPRPKVAICTDGCGDRKNIR